MINMKGFEEYVGYAWHLRNLCGANLRVSLLFL